MKVSRKKYLSIKQIYKLDKDANKKYFIPSFVLMENAGKSVAEFVISRFNKKSRIIIFCGPGKNAGDGFVVARYLKLKDYDIDVVLCEKENSYSGDTKLNLKIIKKLEVNCLKFEEVKNLNRYNLIIDALFGIGLNRNISGKYLRIIEKINNSGKKVVSIDIPSGINGDTGDVMGIAIKSDYTITMGFLKKGFRNNITKKFLGKVIIADIGYPG